MLYKTKGIILHSLKYSETSLIVKAYTEHEGLKSYIIRGAYSKRSVNKASLFKPLARISLVAYNNNKTQLHNLKEIEVTNSFSDVYTNFFKSSIVLFINEVLYHSIKEEEKNPELFNFIENSIFELETCDDDFFNHHLVFMSLLMRHLGFNPQNNYNSDNKFFNLKEGLFEQKEKPDGIYIQAPLSKTISDLIASDYTNIKISGIGSSTRRELLLCLIKYYQLHIPSFGELKSHKVLESVLS